MKKIMIVLLCLLVWASALVTYAENRVPESVGVEIKERLSDISHAVITSQNVPTDQEVCATIGEDFSYSYSGFPADTPIFTYVVKGFTNAEDIDLESEDTLSAEKQSDSSGNVTFTYQFDMPDTHAAVAGYFNSNGEAVVAESNFLIKWQESCASGAAGRRLFLPMLMIPVAEPEINNVTFTYATNCGNDNFVDVPPSSTVSSIRQLGVYATAKYARDNTYRIEWWVGNTKESSNSGTVLSNEQLIIGNVLIYTSGGGTCESNLPAATLEARFYLNDKLVKTEQITVK